MKKLIIAAAAAVAITGTAQAEEFKFNFDRELLTTQSGVEKVYDRLQRRIDSFCEDPGIRSLDMRAYEAECKQSLMDQVVNQIGSTRLVSVHRNYLRVASAN
ncbi:UrcA family protein [Parvularcula sp. IMCC14364]|uniref:UrcA family protein n=1 Tax=Parvularcula sp. IMCC14364 TaxID=3067902 RepID=UPI002740EDAF|nr:UrcA family protein [Parvularcula sp. IMCC14364]